MRRHFVVPALALAVLPAQSVPAQRPVPAGRVVEGTLGFDARASAGDFSGATSTVAGEMTGGGGVTQVRGWVEAAVGTLKTGNGRRDKDLNKSMESDKYPTMRFELAEVVLRGGAEGRSETDGLDVTLRGTFLIHGVARGVALPARVRFVPEGIRVRSDFPLNVKDYGIQGLNKLFGMLRMYPDILVHVDLVFAPEEGGRPVEGDSGASVSGTGPAPRAPSPHGSTLARP